MHVKTSALLIGVLTLAASPGAAAAGPVTLIFDTDMGNDVDDALALGLIHALQSQGECKLLAVTVTKDNPFAAPCCDAINTFYGRGDVPIGTVRGGKTPADSPFIRALATATDETLTAWLLGEAERQSIDLVDDVDAVHVVQAHLAYFEEIGAVGPRASS